MSNVKAGDFAKVTGGPGSEGCVGMLVLVIGPPDPRELSIGDIFRLVQSEALHGQLWKIQALESRMRAGQELLKAGDILVGADKYLKRIDPPEDGEDIFDTAPLQSEKEPVHG